MLSESAFCAEGDPLGVDAVVTLDSSGSMKKTDPLSLRRPAAKLFVSLLGEHDRVGVVSFSESSEWLSELSDVSGSAGKKKLFPVIDAVSSTGPYTNLLAALQSGFEALKSSPKKKKMILLMTDGKMDLGSAEKDAALLEELKTGLLPQIALSGIKVHTIAFAGLSDQALLKEIALATSGQYILASNDRGLHLAFASIFERVKSPDAIPVENDSFGVDDSVREMTLLVTKKNAATRISLISPSGRQFGVDSHGMDVQWFETQAFEMITILNPERGRWKLRYNAPEGNRVFVVANLRLVSSFDKLFVQKGETVRIDAWLEREKDQLNVRELMDNVALSAVITDSEGRASELKLSDNGSGGDQSASDGVFSAAYAPGTTGDYTLRIIAAGKTFTREKEYRFSVIEKMQAAGKQVHVDETAASEQVEDEPVNWWLVLLEFIGLNLAVALLIAGWIKVGPIVSGKIRRKE